ncbi:MAG TPA: hypothetical protein VF043_37505 [Ktedonobacteraceae bacterium]
MRYSAYDGSLRAFAGCTGMLVLQLEMKNKETRRKPGPAPTYHMDTQTDERFPRRSVWHSLHFARRYHIIGLDHIIVPDFLLSEQQRLFAARDGDM